MNQLPSQDPLYAGPRQGVRAQFTPRGPQLNGSSALHQGGKHEEPVESNRDRAARYEDEKRRIVASCFAKKEDDGVAIESYITHVRVVEDGAYPSVPPPPDSSPANKKSRVILVSVKKNGRVRVHKARENPTGTFSIGKTWNMEELLSIQSYTNFIPRNDQEDLHKQWANGTGFIVTLGKPYYWQAPTSKEKDFFIGSLVKIYRKYTGGKLPELYGFASQEIELLTGAGSTPNPQLQTPPLPSQAISPPPPIPASNEWRSHSPHSVQSQGSDQTGRARSLPRNDQTPPARDAQRPPPIEPLRSPMRMEDRHQSRDNVSQRSFESSTKAQFSEQPQSTVYMQTTNARPSLSPHSSQQSIPPEKANGRMLNGVPRTSQSPYAELQQTASGSTHSGGSRPSTAVSEQRQYESKLERSAMATEPFMDRTRPFLGKPDAHLAPKSGAASETNSQFATPAATPSDLREEKVPEFPLISNEQTTSPPPVSRQEDLSSAEKSSRSMPAPPEQPTIERQRSAHELATVAPTSIDTVANETSTTPKKAEEEHRPGLGPMIKKKSAKDIAGQFRKAAIAAGAFQPRQGGAGARLKALQDKDKDSNEPDGITSVVPAPLFRGMSSDTVKPSVPATPTAAIFSPEPIASLAPVNLPATEIRRTATEDSMTAPEAPVPAPASATVPVPVILTPDRLDAEVRSPSPEKSRSRSPERRKRQRQEAELSRFCSALDIDPRLFDGRGAEFNDLLTEFGWDGKLVEDRRMEDFEADIKREIGRAQATGWLGHIEQQEGKVQDLAKAFDKAIEECEELDGLFTLYSHELDTLATDIEYIEAQSQGLQVQTANQKLLQNELNTLLRTLTIPSSDLRGLQSGSLDSETGIETVERSLTLLHKALVTIDPDIQQSRTQQTIGRNPDRGGVGVYADAEIGQMRAVLEKKNYYRDVTTTFIRRFNQHVSVMFKDVERQNVQTERQQLWRYNSIMLFVREVNSYEWRILINGYESALKNTYQNQFREYAMDQRKKVRKPGGDELEALFTTQEKEKTDENLASTAARKLTVKRGKTVKSGVLRHQLGDKRDGKLDAYEVFGIVLKHQGNTVSEEQNFAVRFFHISSQTGVDFAELVVSTPPNQRKLPNLNNKQSYDPDRDMAKTVQNLIEGVYSFWLNDLQNLLDWCLGMDPLQGVGVLTAIEQCLATYEETNQEFIGRTLRTIHDRLTGLYHKFVDEQIRAIEDTKVKISKRKGIISFMKTFPLFSAVIEQMIPTSTSSSDILEVRFIVNESYGKILKAMWESLNFIAKDDTAAGGSALVTAPGHGDPEDKEALNYHILLIENMNHYLEEVDTVRNIVLDEWADKARQDFATHLALYTDSVIRRPLGKWLDFLEGTEAMLKNSDAGGISGKASHSRSAAKKVLSSYDSKEVKKGIDTLKKRIEKHFSMDTEESSNASKNLVARVFEECNARYAGAHDRMKVVIDRVYEGNLEIDWRKEEAAAMFKR